MTLIPAQVTFRGLAHSDELATAVRERIGWLEQFHPGIVRCRVLVEVPHRHRQDGRQFHIRIEVTVPRGVPIVVSHDASLHSTLKDVEEAEHHKTADVDAVHRYGRVAIHAAFDAARRQLEDVAREQREPTGRNVGS